MINHTHSYESSLCPNCDKPRKVVQRGRKMVMRKTCGNMSCAHAVQAASMMKTGEDGLSRAQKRAAKAVETLKSRDPDYFRKHAQRILTTLGEEGLALRGKQCSQTKQSRGAVNQSALAKYRRSVTHFTRKQDLSDLPNFEKLKQGYQIDHILSVVDGFKAQLNPKQVAHKANLQVISRAENRAKYTRSDMTVKELLEKISAW